MEIILQCFDFWIQIIILFIQLATDLFGGIVLRVKENNQPVNTVNKNQKYNYI